ncbi:tenascin-like [Apis dorsata]|uniref:tenascin-like n=1 Tax=Apis dorsata TaxID=7462 RepID=UPI0003DF6C60|nr:tenascin-like [Apis dorsata]
MNDQIFKFFLLFASFQLLLGLEQDTLEYGNVKIGEKCERDRNCIPNSYCRAQKTCLCEQYFSPTLDNSMCIASAGLSCANDFACSTMANAACRQGVCACKDSYILDINNSSNCVNRPLMVGDRCQRTDECQDMFGRAMCINERCECISSYHFVNETGKCVQTRYLYHTCTKDYECKGYDTFSILECKKNECVCKEGTCSKGSKFITVLGILVIPILLLI